MLVKAKGNWAQIPNTWLRDENISLKTKGLLAVMQSLPDDWNFSVTGLASILKDGVDAVRNAIHEAEQAGYLTREQVRDEQGRVSDTIYRLFEQPPTGFSPMDSPRQYNIDKYKKDKTSSAVGGRGISSSCSQNAEGEAEAVAPPDFSDVVDLKKAGKSARQKDGAYAAYLLEKSGKQGRVTGQLVKLVSTQAKQYGKETLLEVVQKAKFDSFWSKKGLMAVLSNAGIEDLLNRDNKTENILELPKDDPRRVEYMKNHPELW